MATIKQLTAHHFYHGDFGWYGNAEEIWWDGEDGVEPTEEEVQHSHDYWMEEGLNEAAREYAEGLADYRYEQSRD